MKLIIALLLFIPGFLFSKEFDPKLYNQVLEECLLDLKNVSKSKKSVIAHSIELIKKSSLDPTLKKLLTAKSSVVLSRFKKAEEITNAILKSNKQNKDAWLIKGLATRYTGNLEESLRCLKNALNKDEKSEYVLYELSMAYLYLHKSDLAIKTLEKLIKINPENIKARIKLGRAWHNAKKPEIALRVYEETLIKSPGNSLLHYNIGIISYQLSQEKKSIRHLKKCLEANPNDWLAIKKLIQIYDKKGNLSEVKKYHLQMINLRKSNKAPNLKKKNLYVMGITKKELWDVYTIFYFEKSNLLANQICFSAIEKKSGQEKMKFNLVSSTEGNQKKYLLNIYYPDKSLKKYKQYEKLPAYETLKNDVLNHPLFVKKTNISNKKK